MIKKIFFLLCLLVALIFKSEGQIKSFPDFSNEKSLQTVNRKVTVVRNNKKTTVHLNAGPGTGIAWISDTRFTTGSIEADIKGKNVFQESFIGIAFHGANDTTYEAVYLRPFNFNATDQQRRQHAVQYIALPGFDWAYLRGKFPGRYESALLKTADPDAWVHLKIIVTKDTICVFINADAQPCLTVKRLAQHASGKIGYWVGNGSDGDFANLRIQLK